MKVAFFDTHKFERPVFEEENKSHRHEFVYFETKLNEKTVEIAKGFPCICVFVNDRLNRKVLETLSTNGTRYIALRSAGFNHVDLVAARELGIKVARVPEYSPYAVAEFAVSLLLTLNRKTHRAYNRVREGNFSLDGLVGYDLHQKTVGVIGTGKIGAVFCRIMRGFGCRVLAYDIKKDESLLADGFQYTELNELLRQSDIISLHVPLSANTLHMIDQKAFELMKKGVILINTGRGALIDTKALITALKAGQVGGAGLDVYEEEEGVFFSDLSGQVLQDDILVRLMTFPNVLLTSHQAFLTQEALSAIAKTTLFNVTEMEIGRGIRYEIQAASN